MKCCCCCCFFCYYVYVSISKPPVCEIVTSLSDTPVCEIVVKSITDVQMYEIYMILLLNMPECEIVTVFL